MPLTKTKIIFCDFDKKKDIICKNHKINVKNLKKGVDKTRTHIYNMSTNKNKKKEGESMKDRILAIYDLEVDYVSRLMEYISEKRGMPFKTIAFTEREELFKYVSESYIDVLLVSSTIMDENIGDINVGKIILLSPESVVCENIVYSVIYKYQSTENIINEVLEHFVEAYKDNNMVSISKNNTQVIGVYSPLGRTGKTTFALTLGQILAEKRSTLYINLEEFSAFDKLFEANYKSDLSDLMYFFKQNPETLPIKLHAVVQKLHDMDYVPPLVFSEDLRNFEPREWINLLEKIIETGTYETIVIDLSNMVKNVFEILEICSSIYMPIVDDRISLMKVSTYEEYLLKTERQNILNRTVKVKIPETEGQKWNENYLEQQPWGQLGDFIRKILREAA